MRRCRKCDAIMEVKYEHWAYEPDDEDGEGRLDFTIYQCPLCHDIEVV